MSAPAAFAAGNLRYRKASATDLRAHGESDECRKKPPASGLYPVAARGINVMEHYGRALRLEELINRQPGSLERAIVGDGDRAVLHDLLVQVLQGQNG